MSVLFIAIYLIWNSSWHSVSALQILFIGKERECARGKEKGRGRDSVKICSPLILSFQCYTQAETFPSYLSLMGPRGCLEPGGLCTWGRRGGWISIGSSNRSHGTYYVCIKQPALLWGLKIEWAQSLQYSAAWSMGVGINQITAQQYKWQIIAKRKKGHALEMA